VRVPTELDEFGYSVVDAAHGTAFLHVNHGLWVRKTAFLRGFTIEMVEK
jgi:hypothetical protein